MTTPPEAVPGAAAERASTDAEPPVAHLLVRAGEGVCALPLASVRKVVKALVVHRLPGAAPELLGLAEYGGEPLAVLDLARLVGAAAGANPTHPVTVVVAAGPAGEEELVGIAADAALEVVALAASAIAGGGAGLAVGEAEVGGEVVRILDLAGFAGRDDGR